MTDTQADHDAESRWNWMKEHLLDSEIGVKALAEMISETATGDPAVDRDEWLIKELLGVASEIPGISEELEEKLGAPWRERLTGG